MCLFKIKVDEEEDERIAVRERRVRRRRADRIALSETRRVSIREPHHHRRSRDSYSEDEEETRRYSSFIPPPQAVPQIPGQKPLVIRPASPASPDVQFVHVSPRSSSSSSSDRRGEYVYERRETRIERSPERFHEYRYVGAPEPEPEYPRERQRRRSRSGDRRERRDREDDYDETKIRIHRREYH
jgi:hypothetical protein